MKWLITGGAGFIGANLARRLVTSGHEVVIFDNLSRVGAALNVVWLEEAGPVRLVRADVRDFDAVAGVLNDFGPFDAVAHQAAQVAVTTSVKNPREDFEINALGSFNLLEAIRMSGQDPVVLYASTNKVYGGLEDLDIVEEETRYRFANLPGGVPEERALDFHSPYGCSKGAADQYMRDYARIYGLRTIVCRQSCIYGPRQFGVEDQGWVAWFIIASVLRHPITVFGNGRQLRDLLFIDDLVDVYLRLVERHAVTAGRIYNIGGGPAGQLSLLELLDLLKSLVPGAPPHTFADPRAGDQPVYVSDIRAVERDTGWRPQVGVEEGIGRLTEWVRANRHMIAGTLAERVG